MNNLQTLIIVLAVVVFAVLFVAVIMPYMRKRGVNLEKILAQSQEAVQAATNAFALVKPFIDDTQRVDAIDKVLTSAQVGVGNAEQLYKLGELPADKRKEAAAQYVRDTLNLAGVAWTPDIARLADGAIEASVNALGRTA